MSRNLPRFSPPTIEGAIRALEQRPDVRRAYLDRDGLLAVEVAIDRDEPALDRVVDRVISRLSEETGLSRAMLLGEQPAIELELSPEEQAERQRIADAIFGRAGDELRELYTGLADAMRASNDAQESLAALLASHGRGYLPILQSRAGRGTGLTRCPARAHRSGGRLSLHRNEDG